MYSVDRIENEIVVLQNLDTKENIEIEKKVLPENIHDGSILSLVDEVFILRDDEEFERRKRIEEKLNRLKGLKKNNE